MNTEKAPASSTNGAAVETDGVSVSFAGEYALRPTTLRVGSGQAIVVSGRSGSGKSTLLRVIAGLLSPSQGEVRLWGQLRYSGDHRIGITLDEPSLWPWMKAADTVACLAGLNGVRIKREETSALLRELNLADAARTKASALSQGMARRVQLAGALAVGRDLLLLDEPTASLDSENRGVVWDCLERRRRVGTPIVVATHDDSWQGHLEVNEVIELSSQ